MTRRRWSLFSTRWTHDLAGTVWSREGVAVFCRACGRRFTTGFGLANHGLAHVRRGDAETAVNQGVYVFYLSESEPDE